jgi:hypothetical protein
MSVGTRTAGLASGNGDGFVLDDGSELGLPHTHVTPASTGAEPAASESAIVAGAGSVPVTEVAGNRARSLFEPGSARRAEDGAHAEYEP